MTSLSRHRQKEVINQKRTRKDVSQDTTGRKSNQVGNQGNSTIQSKLKMSSAEKVALDGIFRSLQVNKKVAVKEDEKEETITLSKKQLNALIGTINEVCEIVANEPLESFKVNERSYAPTEQQNGSEDSAIKTKDDSEKRMKENRNSKKEAVEKEKEQKKVASSKPVKTSNESILGLLEPKSKPARTTNESILGLLDTKSKPVRKKLNDEDQIDKSSKQKTNQTRQRRVSTVSKAVSPIIVFEKRNTVKESKNKAKDIAKKGKTFHTTIAVPPDNSTLNTQRSNASEELIIKSDRFLLPSELTPKMEKHFSSNDPEPVVSNIAKEDSSRATETAHLTLLEKKKQQWEQEKRENSMLEKAIIGQPKTASKVVGKDNAVPRKTTPPTDNLSRKSTAEIKSPTHVIEQPAAMLDHFQLANFNDVLVMKRKEQKQWVSELEQQREEQLLKKFLDEELRKSCIIVTPRQASTLLAEVYEESKLEPQESHVMTAKQRGSRHSEDNALKVLVQNKVRTTLPAPNPIATFYQTQYNESRNNIPEKQYQSSNENREKTFVSSQHNKPQKTDVYRENAGSDPKYIQQELAKTDESAQDAYNSAQTHLVFHQAFEQPVSVTDRAKNDFGRFKALIDPSEIDRQRKERERQLEHMKMVQQQIEEKNREKEKQKLKEKEEEMEDEARIRRELAQVNNAAPTDYNRTRPQPQVNPVNEHDASNVMQPNPETNKFVYNQNKSMHRPSHAVAAAPSNHYVQRQDSDLNVDYVNHDEHNLDRYTEVKSLGEGNIGYTTTPSVTRTVDKPSKAQLETVENLRQQKKEVLSKLRKQSEPQGKSVKQQSRPARVGANYIQHVETRRTKSPPVPAQQKNTLKTPANPARAKRLSAATHNAPPTTIGTEDRNETSRTQPTVISSRFVDPEIANDKGVEVGSQPQYVPFRRSSAHMDPAIQSSRPPLASDYPDGHHSNYDNAHNPNPHNQQRQKAILQQLSTLKRGLMEKQREYDRETSA